MTRQTSGPYPQMRAMSPKKDRTEGSVQVVVQGPGFLHQAQLPVSSVMQVRDYAAWVGYARSLSAAVSGR